mgnify:CR=1 FL=1
MSKGLTIIDKDYTQWVENLSVRYRQSRRKSKPRIAQVLLGTWSRHRRNAR